MNATLVASESSRVESHDDGTESLRIDRRCGIAGREIDNSPFLSVSIAAPDLLAAFKADSDLVTVGPRAF